VPGRKAWRCPVLDDVSHLSFVSRDDDVTALLHHGFTASHLTPRCACSKDGGLGLVFSDRSDTFKWTMNVLNNLGQVVQIDLVAMCDNAKARNKCCNPPG
jgi:hypothetical protein